MSDSCIEFQRTVVILQEEFLDVVYWMRQLVSIVVGLSWGAIPLTGAVGLLA